MPDYKRTMRRRRKEDMKLGAMPTIVHKNILTRMYQKAHTHNNVQSSNSAQQEGD